jgi:hypothetical protein
MKRMLAIMMMVACGMAAKAEVTPDEVLGAVDKMTPEQAHAFSQKLEAKLWQPVPEGFFSRMALDMGVSGGSLDDAGLSGLTLSGGDLDVESVGGLDLGIFWRLFDPRFRLGLRMGSWGSTDSNLGPAGYSRVDLLGSTLALAANMQWVRNPNWLIWTEVAPGSGSVRMDVVDTPVGQATTLRSFDGGYALLDLQAGAAWRLNAILSVFVSGGYRFAESIDLEEGGTETALDFNASGGFGRVGVGVNF